MKSEKTPVVAVLGGNTCSSEIYNMAYQVGKLIAQRNATLICGGKGGVMEAACKGALEAGGMTIGILPGEDRIEGNPYVKYAIATGMGIGRNVIIVRSADVVISIDGKYGTLSEISFALQLNKPVVAIEPPVDLEGITICNNPEDAVKKAFWMMP